MEDQIKIEHLSPSIDIVNDLIYGQIENKSPLKAITTGTMFTFSINDGSGIVNFLVWGQVECNNHFPSFNNGDFVRVGGFKVQMVNPIYADGATMDIRLTVDTTIEIIKSPNEFQLFKPVIQFTPLHDIITKNVSGTIHTVGTIDRVGNILTSPINRN